jgi:hypothetical protein
LDVRQSKRKTMPLKRGSRVLLSVLKCILWWVGHVVTIYEQETYNFVQKVLIFILSFIWLWSVFRTVQANRGCRLMANSELERTWKEAVVT